MRPFIGHSATYTIKIAIVVMADVMLTARARRVISNDEMA
jgi:hypothetical protein